MQNTPNTPTPAASDIEATSPSLPKKMPPGGRTLRPAVALFAAGLVGLSIARAQTANTPTAAPTPSSDAGSPDETPIVLDSFEVTGYKASAIKAEEKKREEDQVIDAINAQDIGKFPDRSLGEAMQRIPGVQISRDHGEATDVLIRGLPDLVTTVNGDDIFTGNGRRLSMQDVPAQALSSIEVFKTATPDLQEGGIAGLLNIQLRTPFEFKDNTASAYIEYRYTDPRGTTASSMFDPTVGGLVSRRWKTSMGEFGLLIDATYIKDRYNNPIQWLDVPDRVWAVDGQGNGHRLDDSAIGADGKYIAPDGTTLAIMPMVGGVYGIGERKRSMAHAAAQWKVNNDLEFHSQFLYTGYRSRWEDDFLFTVSQWANNATNVVVAPDGPYTDTIFGKISQILSADVQPVGNGTDPYTAASTQAHDSSTNTFYYNLGGRYRMDALTWTSDFSFVDSRYKDNRVIIDQNVPSPSLKLYGYDDKGHGGFQASTTTSADPLADPSQFQLRGLFQSWDDQRGSQIAWRNDFNYALSNSFLHAIKAGFRLSDHEAKNHHAEGGADVPDPAIRPNPVSVFGASFEDIVPGVDRLGGPFATPSANFLLDHADVVRTYYGLSPDRLPENPNALFNQKEEIGSVYLEAQYGFNLGSISFKGIAGARAIRTERTLRGESFVGEIDDEQGHVVSPSHLDNINIKGHDDNVLPSTSAVIQWLSNLQSHLAVGKTIRRPEFGDLNPALNATPATINRPGYASAGNPYLKPVRSLNYDATLEYYFEKNGYIQASGFYRKIDGYLQSFGQYEMIDGQQYLVTRPNNSGKGTLKGFELAAQKFFDFLPGPLKNLGVLANYTYIEGENETRTGLNSGDYVQTGLAGVARNNFNTALIYETSKFSARLALTHRGSYVDGLRTARFQFDDWVKASNYLDLSVTYELSKNVSLQFDALNLTGENYESYQGNVIRPRDIRYGSRTFVVGLHYKL